MKKTKKKHTVRKMDFAIIVLTILLSACMISGCVSKLRHCDGIPKTLKKAGAVDLAPILIYDGTNPIEISIEDAGKFHGEVCPCVVIAFRATQQAISRLWNDQAPQRNDFRITSAHPADGIQDTFDFITRVKTGEGRKDDFRIELPRERSEKDLGAENYVFTFIRKSTGKAVTVKVRSEVFPEKLFNLCKKMKSGNPEVVRKHKTAFKSAKKRLKDAFMNLPSDKLFEYEEK